jgi:GAF domain-containing protein
VTDRAKELAALSAIAATVGESLDLDEVLNEALDKTLQVMEVDAGGIYLLDDEAGVLTIAVQRGLSPQFVAKIDRLTVGEGFSGRVAQSVQPLVVGNLSTDPRLTRTVVREEGLQSLAVVPLSCRGKSLGTLFVSTYRHREFSEQDIQLLASIGHQIGVAIENARLFEAEQRRAEEFRVISEVGRRITSIMAVDELLGEIARVLKETLGYYLVGIALIEGDELVFKAGAGAIWERDGFQPPRLKVGQEGITGWVASSGEALLVPDVYQEPRYYALPESSEMRSELAVPLKTKESVIGVLHVQSRQLNAFDQHDLTLLESLAHQAAMAIDNARLFEAERKRRQAATLLAEMSKLISGTLDLDQVLRLTAEYAVDVFDVDCCCILLRDEARGTLRPAVHTGFDHATAATITEVDFTPSETLRRVLFEQLRPLIVEDVPSEPYLTPADLLDLQSALVVPIEVGGRILGAVQLGIHGPKRRRFTSDEGELALALANQAAVAIENADLFDAEQRRAEQFRVISEVGRSVTSILNVDEILEHIVGLVKDTLGYHQVAIGLTEGDTLVFSTAAGAFWDELASEPLHLKIGQDGISGWVAQSGEPLLVPDVSQEPRYYRTPGDLLTKSELAVPLRTKDAVIGVMAVSSERLDGFDETDLAVLQSLAHQAALAIDNARLFAAQQRRAEQFRVISEVGRRITSIRAVSDLLRQMTRLIREAFDYHGVGIGLIEGDNLVFKAGAGSFWDDPDFETLSLRVGRDGITGWVAQTGEPLLVPDVSQEPRYFAPPLPEAKKTCSELAVPMKTKGTVIGVLDVESDRLDAFDESDLVVLQSLANQAAIAIENARLFDAEQRRAEQFWVISAVGRQITSILNIDEVLVEVVRLIQRAFDYDHVAIALIEVDEAVYQVGAGTLWDDPEFDFRPRRLKVGLEGITGWVAARGEPLLVADVRQDPRYVWMKGSNTRSELAVPIKTKGETVGVLDVQSERLDAFDESDLAVLQSLAHQAGIAIQNARLFKAEARRAEQFRVISEVGRRITSILAVDELLEAMARLIQKAFDYYLVEIGLIEGDQLTFKTRAGRDLGSEFQAFQLKVDQRSITGWVAATGEPLRVPDVSREPRYVRVTSTRTRSELVVPLKVKEKIIGVLNVESERLDAFDESDLVVLQSLADQAAVAIENARHYEQAQRVATLEERQRLARELHDAVTQTLFSASLISEALPAVWQIDQTEGRQLLGELQQLSRGALAEMRTLLMELRPTALAEANLGDLLRQLAEAVTGRTGLRVSVTVEGRCSPPSDVHVALYRIAQEALNNVVKHARASQVDIRLDCLSVTAPGTKGRVELRVSDDGRGFDTGRIPPDRLGLGIIRERAQAIGAALQIESQSGQGTQVIVVWGGES